MKQVAADQFGFDFDAPPVAAFPTAALTPREPVGKTEYKISGFSKAHKETPAEHAREMARILRKGSRPASAEILEYYDAIAEGRPERECPVKNTLILSTPAVDVETLREKRDLAWQELDKARRLGHDDTEPLLNLGSYQAQITAAIGHTWRYRYVA